MSLAWGRPFLLVPITAFLPFLRSRDTFHNRLDAVSSGNSTFTHTGTLSHDIGESRNPVWRRSRLKLHTWKWQYDFLSSLFIQGSFGLVFLRLEIMLQVLSCGSLSCEISESHYRTLTGVISSVFLRILLWGNSTEFCSAGEKDFLQPLSGFCLFQKDIRELLLLHS